MEIGRLRPDNLIMGMEIRSKVKEYVRLRIRAIREESGRKEASVLQALYSGVGTLAV